MRKIDVTLEHGATQRFEAGTPVGALVPAGTGSVLPYVAAMVNHDLVSLSYPLTVTSTVRFVAMDDPHGLRVQRNSVSFLLAKAIRKAYPKAVFSIDHSIGQSLYCSFHATPDAPEGLEREALAELEASMRSMIKDDLPIERHKLSYCDAIDHLRTAGREDATLVLKHRNPPHVVIHACDGFYDLAHAPLAPSTGMLTCFQLIHYPPGFVLHLPKSCPLDQPPDFEDQPHLFAIFHEHKEWGRILGVNTAGHLNDIIAGGKVRHFIRTAEALHEKKVARIADTISDRRDSVKLILIAGPSSAGKTTFAKRLSIHLTVNGMRPVTLSTDDYFVGIDRNPVDEQGQPDFEHVEAVDLELFNQDLTRLIRGDDIEIPRFNFETKSREYRGETLQIKDDMVVIIEGIHALNPRLTSEVPKDSKYRIYVSALTQLSIDSNNRISTTDNRLLRRIIRDHKFRGHSTLDTLRMWPAVRRGEHRWIFPFQREADATFNSALDYELAVLKPIAEPLLMQVKPCVAEYAEARRLSEFLLNFLPATDEFVPHTSILREYIGRSGFDY